MMFSSLIGNPSARHFLETAASSVHSPQVFLLTGPKGVGKRSFATAFAKQLLGSKHLKKIEGGVHPDLLYFQPEGKTYMHPIASIRKILEEASFPPFEASHKIYVIEEVERMLPSSSNALLKTLEEPQAHLRFLLTSSRSEEILPTIASRCCRVPFYPIDESLLLQFLMESKGIAREQAAQIAIASQGSFAKCEQIANALDDPLRLAFLDVLKNHFLLPLSFDLASSLEKWEKLLEKKQETESDPGLFLEKVDSLFEDLLFWLRDLHVVHAQLSSPLYHFACIEDLRKQTSLRQPPSLEKVSLLVEEARVALQRSMKPRVVLEHLFSQIHYVG